jgi:hypothetical protein
MKKKANIHPLAEAASAYTGYTSRDTNNIFLIDAGYTGTFQWDGAFIDRVLKDAAASSGLPVHANVNSALGYYIRNGWVHTKPKPGDLVFYNFALNGGTATFDPLHIGLVLKTDAWKTDSRFTAIEGNVDSGLPRGPRDNNGVYERTRYATDVLAFVRIPKRYLGVTVPTDIDAATTLHIIKPAHLNRCATASTAATAKPEFRKSVELVQLALAAHPGVQLQNADRGVFNSKTAAALAAFKRVAGYKPAACTTEANVESLAALAAQPSTVIKFHVEP